VEEVVDHLEKQADALGEVVEARQLVIRQRRAALGAEQDRRADQGAGLVHMHELQLGARQLLAGALDVDHLAAGHAARAGRLCQQPKHAELALRIVGQDVVGEQQEGLRLQGVADQQRGGLVVLDMAGRLAAAQDVVVHAGQVVVHQGVGVDHLDGAAGDVEARRIGAGKFSGGMAQQGTNPLAAAEGGVAHRPVQALRGNVGGGQQVFQRTLGALLHGSHPALEIHRVYSGAPDRSRSSPASSTWIFCSAAASAPWQCLSRTAPRW
jgi:hypothetical protein